MMKRGEFLMTNPVQVNFDKVPTLVQKRINKLLTEDNEKRDRKQAIINQYYKDNTVIEYHEVSEDITIVGIKNPFSDSDDYEYANCPIMFEAFIDGKKTYSQSSYTFDSALVVALTAKYKHANAFEYILRMVDIPFAPDMTQNEEKGE